MSPAGAERRALRPLWWLATGAALGAVAALAAGLPVPSTVGRLLVLAGAAVAAAALAVPRWWPLWLLAGLALGGGRGTAAITERLRLAELAAAGPAAALRLEVTIQEGWEPSRWGWRTTVTVSAAHHREQQLRLRGQWRLEARGAAAGPNLPAPGSVVAAMATIRGDDDRPMLVVDSPRLLETRAGPAGLPALRDHLARSTLAAAGTDLGRIRAAEMAAALALGRRDLLARERRDGWRRSGLAHLLAVSGLNVGMVAGGIWLALTALRLRPRRVRWLMLAAVPAYTVLAGAAPSAVRAALMAALYLGGRQLGRAVIPMSSLLLAATVLVLAEPLLVADPGFQLTVLVTAALVRWVPPTVDRLPVPRRLAAVAAVPIVAQLAAAPIVAAHFHNVVPGGLVANLLVPPLLAPSLGLSLLAVLLSPLWPGGAAVVLDLVGITERLLWLGGGPGRALELVVPGTPPVVVAALAIAGWLALRPGRGGVVGAAAWCALSGALAGWWALRPPPAPPRVALLEIADGLAATVATRDGVILVDGGRWHDQAAELLADDRVRRLAAVVASHPDEDHLGGLARVLEVVTVERLVLPAWARSSEAMAPLLRTARRRGTAIVPAARGSVVRVGETEMRVLWPPARASGGADNDRSLVVLVTTEAGAVLVTADIDRTVERRLARSGHLRAAVLVVPHHGSRESCSDALLDAVNPEVVLVPAGPLNRHHHPSREVLDRVARCGAPVRFPLRDGRCGARLVDGRWAPFP
ncbi:MAG TPA: ComEC/Rec2 family competence protein [Thermoanaerobaculales bacterium]|nr:ComEC/Rec2 family competence protein [Thermoanaerobaculales bacterium]HPA79832.1 ComEC/Rec2 family competence protein [Thermoanaerobaculales bacterium]HQL31261.1 ComEC/Rec2 family competence protein [Thermoanaerobaculales bacterium]HQN94867.1 ComEC/Rec2 family competence protein [Thermoanaerobaculales bacterium]HQP43343.1 ComEC/Rec2 family competence protein [Thermoanaerobaculales bacterium]